MKGALAVVTVLLAPMGGSASGSTEVTKTGKFHAITFSTPRMIFDDDRAESGYHADARKEFEALHEAQRKNVERAVETLRKEFAKTAPLEPWSEDLGFLTESELGESPGEACRMRFAISFPAMGTLELAFEKAPTAATFTKMQARVSDLFTEKRMKR